MLVRIERAADRGSVTTWHVVEDDWVATWETSAGTSMITATDTETGRSAAGTTERAALQALADLMYGADVTLMFTGRVD